MMNIRIEGDHTDLKAIHQIIYGQDDTAIVEEIYQSTPGFHSEPIVIAIITALSSTVIAAIREFVKFQTLKMENETKRQEIANKLEIEKIKLFVEFTKGNYKVIPVEDIDKISEQ